MHQSQIIPVYKCAYQIWKQINVMMVNGTHNMYMTVDVNQK